MSIYEVQKNRDVSLILGNECECILGPYKPDF